MDSQGGQEKDVELNNFTNRRPESGSTMAARDGNGELGQKDVENFDAESVPRSGASTSDDDAQNGVKNMEAVAMTWTKWGLIFAYIRYVFAHDSN